MLWGIRGLVKQIRDADKMGGRLGAGMKRDRAMELANAVAELDAHLSDNGMLPLAWLPPEAAEGGTAGTIVDVDDLFNPVDGPGHAPGEE